MIDEKKEGKKHKLKKKKGKTVLHHSTEIRKYFLKKKESSSVAFFNLFSNLSVLRNKTIHHKDREQYNYLGEI